MVKFTQICRSDFPIIDLAPIWCFPLLTQSFNMHYSSTFRVSQTSLKYVFSDDGDLLVMDKGM